MAIDPAIKLARGTKRVCLSCETRFYDLARAPILCPSCSSEFVPVSRRAAESASRSAWMSGSMRNRPVAIVDPAVAEVTETEELEVKDEADAEEADALPGEDILLEDNEEIDDAAALVEPETGGEEER